MRPLAIVTLAALLAGLLPAQDAAVRDAIATLLRDEPVDVHCKALSVLGSAGPAAAPAMAMVAELIADPRESVRRDAAATLGRLAPHASGALPILIAHLHAPNERIRDTARILIDLIASRRAPTVDELRADLRSRDDDRRRAVFARLTRGSEHSSALVPDLLDTLPELSNQLVHEAINHLRRLLNGLHAAEYVAALRRTEPGRARTSLLELWPQVIESDASDDHGFDELLVALARDRSPMTNRTATHALAERASTRPALLDALQELYETGDRNRRTAVLDEWSRTGAPVADAIPFLARHLHERDHLWSLSRLVMQAGSIAAPVVPALGSMLASGDRYVAPIAAETLAALGPTAAPAADALLQSAAHPDPAVATRALGAMAWIDADPAATERALCSAVLHPVASVRIAALARAAAMEYPGPVLALALIDALDDFDAEVRSCARILAPLAGPDVLAIVSRGEHPSTRIAAALAELQASFGAGDGAQPAAVLHALRCTAAPVRIAGLAVLARQPADLDTALPGLRAALADRDAELFAHAARAVTALRPPAADLVPSLLQRLDDRRSVVREAAHEALAALGTDAVDAALRLLASRTHTAAILAWLAERDELPPAAWPAVEDGSVSSDPRLRAAVRAVLARHGASAAAPARVFDPAESRALRIRLEVCRTDPAASLDALIELSVEAPASIRAQALAAMAPLLLDPARRERVIGAAVQALACDVEVVADAAASLLRTARGAALEPLLRTMIEGDRTARARAGLVARECEPRLTTSVPEQVWRHVFESGRGNLRAAALRRAQTARPAVLRELYAGLIDDADGSIRWEAYTQLEALGAPIHLLARLEVRALEGAPLDSERAVGVLATIGPEGLRAVERVLRDGRGPGRRRAFTVLAQHGSPAPDLFEPAVAALGDDDMGMAEAAAELLAAMQLEPDGTARVRDALRKLLAMTQPRVRVAAILAPIVGRDASFAWPQFEALLGSADQSARILALRALLSCATDDAPLEALLAKLVADPRDSHWALPVLQRFGDPARNLRCLLGQIPTLPLSSYLPGETLAALVPSVPIELEEACVRAVLARMAVDFAAVPVFERVLSAATRTAPALVAELARDPRFPHAEMVIRAIARVDPAVVATWSDNAPTEQVVRIVSAIGAVDGHEELRARLLEPYLEDTDTSLRLSAIRGLASCGQPGAEMLAQRMEAALRRHEFDSALCLPLAGMGDAAEAVVPHILTAMRLGLLDPESGMHTLAWCGARGIAALEVMHAAGQDTRDAIIAGTGAMGPRTKVAALRALIAVQPDWELVADTLMRGLAAREPETRTWAALAVCSLARDRAAAQPALRIILGFPDPVLRARALQTFRVVDEPLDLALLVEALDDPVAAVRVAAARAIAKLGRDAAPCRTALRARLQDSNSEVRQAVREVLRGLGD